MSIRSPLKTVSWLFKSTAPRWRFPRLFGSVSELRKHWKSQLEPVFAVEFVGVRACCSKVVQNGSTKTSSAPMPNTPRYARTHPRHQRLAAEIAASLTTFLQASWVRLASSSHGCHLAPSFAYVVALIFLYSGAPSVHIFVRRVCLGFGCLDTFPIKDSEKPAQSWALALPVTNHTALAPLRQS